MAIAAAMIIAVTAASYYAPRCAAAEVAVGSSTTAIGCAKLPYPAPTDWYFPPSAPRGLAWMQHGFVESKDVWSTLAPQIARRGYLVVATTLPTIALFNCTVENLGDSTGFLNNIAEVFATKDVTTGALASSYATAATKAGRPPVPLPDKLVFVGHSAGWKPCCTSLSD